MKVIKILFFFALSLTVISCENKAVKNLNNENPKNQASIINQRLSADDYEKKLLATTNPQLADVRTSGEFTSGHIKNALNIDVNDPAFLDKMGNFDKSKPVFVYCLSGGRSASAAETLEKAGFIEIYNLDGGILSWRNSGKALDAGLTKQNDNSTLTAEKFKKLVSSKKYVLVDYHAVWCGPCKRLEPVLESIALGRKEKLALVKIDADTNQDLLKSKLINGIPYLELYENGNLVWHHEGYLDEGQLLSETKL